MSLLSSQPSNRLTSRYLLEPQFPSAMNLHLAAASIAADFPSGKLATAFVLRLISLLSRSIPNADVGIRNRAPPEVREGKAEAVRRLQVDRQRPGTLLRLPHSHQDREASWHEPVRHGAQGVLWRVRARPTHRPDLWVGRPMFGGVNSNPSTSDRAVCTISSFLGHTVVVYSHRLMAGIQRSDCTGTSSRG